MGSTEHDDDWEVIQHDEVTGETSFHELRTPLFVLSSNYTVHWNHKERAASNQEHRSEKPLKPDSTENKVGKNRSEQRQCRLLTLPAELRLRIFELVLRSSQPVVELIWSPRNGNRSPCALNLLATCRLVLAEAEQIFYAVNRFKYTGRLIPEAESFFTSVGPRRLSAITSFSMVVVSAGDALAKIEQLPHLPRLQRLYIERKHDIRYLDVSSWRNLTRRIIAALEQLQNLREVSIYTPNAPNMESWGPGRLQLLERLDEMMRQAVATKAASRRAKA